MKTLVPPDHSGAFDGEKVPTGTCVVFKTKIIRKNMDEYRFNTTREIRRRRKRQSFTRL